MVYTSTYICHPLPPIHPTPPKKEKRKKVLSMVHVKKKTKKQFKQ